jgi:hypothetical protein
MQKISLLQLITILHLTISLIIGGVYFLSLPVYSQQNVIENKVNVNIPNDPRNGNNEAIVKDNLIKISSSLSSSSSSSSSFNYNGFDADALSFIKNKNNSLPSSLNVIFFGYPITIINNNTNNNTNNNSAQAQSTNNNNVNNNQKADVVINNPVDLAGFAINNPRHLPSLVSNLIRTGGTSNVFIPFLLFILLISGIISFSSKNIKYKQK